MINHYEVADVIELGRAQDLVLGNKCLYAWVDSVTMFYFTVVIDWLDETE